MNGFKFGIIISTSVVLYAMGALAFAQEESNLLRTENVTPALRSTTENPLRLNTSNSSVDIRALPVDSTVFLISDNETTGDADDGPTRFLDSDLQVKQGKVVFEALPIEQHPIKSLPNIEKHARDERPDDAVPFHDLSAISASLSPGEFAANNENNQFRVADQSSAVKNDSLIVSLAPGQTPDIPIPDTSVLASSTPNSSTPEAQELIQFEPHQPQAAPQVQDLIWWSQSVATPFDNNLPAEQVAPSELLQFSLASSPKIQSISQNPLIRELQVIEADAEFDPVLFTRNLYEDRVDPVGNTLTSLGADLVKDNIFTSDNGIRRKLRTGADFEISQRLGFQNSDSNFFVPQDQGTATLAINMSQPLLRGGGKYYNEIQILIAQTAGGVAWDTLSIELQDELRTILSAYWQLYLDRTNFLQKRKSLNRGEQILEMLESRRDLDSLPSQIARARSAVESRRTAMVNAMRDVKNTEVLIRQLSGDREKLTGMAMEIVPSAPPSSVDLQVPVQKVIQTALENRPEVREAMKRVRIAALQMDMSANEMLPALSLLMGTYVSGLEGESRLGQAIADQFSETTPGYSFGLDFEIPYRNRAAKSRYSQSHLQLKQLQQDLEETTLKVVAEAQIAYRSVKTALATLESSRISIDAANQDLEQQLKRFETFALIEGDLVEGQSPTAILNLLIDAQDRLMTAEGVYSQTMFDLQVAYIALSRATGTLLQHCSVNWDTYCEGTVPAIQYYTNPSAENPLHRGAITNLGSQP